MGNLHQPSKLMIATVSERLSRTKAVIGAIYTEINTIMNFSF
jgi:hypothetical protein